METLKKLFLYILLLFGKILGQTYEITVLGYHTTDIHQTIHDSGKIEFKTQNRGLADIIWPMNNYYNTIYNIENFSLIEWSKNIEQGTYENKYHCIIDSKKNMSYNNNNLIKTLEPVHTIFSLLAMIQNTPSNIIDTKWFNFEHEGKFGKARFLWADSSMAWNGRDSILCDHYRLDLNITDTLKSIGTSKDYFMKNIINDTFIRELWVSKTIKKRIIVAKVQTPWISLTARINSNKEN